MQNGNAQLAIRVDVGMVDRDQESEGGGLVWILFGECHLGLEIAAIEDTVRVNDHETETPAKDVAVDQINPHPLLCRELVHFDHEAVFVTGRKFRRHIIGGIGLVGYEKRWDICAIVLCRRNSAKERKKSAGRMDMACAQSTSSHSSLR